jgi:DNA-binding Xre family transcriptional regulator
VFALVPLPLTIDVWLSPKHCNQNGIISYQHPNHELCRLKHCNQNEIISYQHPNHELCRLKHCNQNEIISYQHPNHELCRLKHCSQNEIISYARWFEDQIELFDATRRSAEVDSKAVSRVKEREFQKVRCLFFQRFYREL